MTNDSFQRVESGVRRKGRKKRGRKRRRGERRRAWESTQLFKSQEVPEADQAAKGFFPKMIKAVKNPEKILQSVKLPTSQLESSNLVSYHPR